MPGELPGQCKFLPRVKGESGSHGPLHRILPRGQLPSFPAALGSGGYLCGVGGQWSGRDHDLLPGLSPGAGLLHH